eukprot:6084531-Lingulodinium_polyedra.AAC.1
MMQIMRDIAKAKTSWVNASGMAQSIVSLVDADNNWSWAKKIDEYPQLTAHIEHMGQFLKLHPFWQDVVVECNLKKAHDKETIMTQYTSKYQSFMGDVQRCEQLTNCIMRMHKSRGEMQQ